MLPEQRDRYHDHGGRAEWDLAVGGTEQSEKGARRDDRTHYAWETDDSGPKPKNLLQKVIGG